MEVWKSIRSLAITEDSFLQINQCVEVDIYINMRNLLNQMKVTLAKPFDEWPILLSEWKLFILERYKPGFSVNKLLLPRHLKTSLMAWKMRDLIHWQRELYATSSTLLFRFLTTKLGSSNIINCSANRMRTRCSLIHFICLIESYA